MARILDTWRNLSPVWQAAIVSGLVIAIAAVAVGAYLALRRPADISNPSAAFVEPKRETKTVKRTVDWPLFGYDDARTKFLPSKRVRPPFKRIWRYDAKELVEFAPIIVDGTLYAIDNAGVFFALDGRTGKLRWKRDYGTLNASSPAYSNGVLYAVNLEPGQAFAVRATDGKIQWRASDLGVGFGRSGRFYSTPAVAFGRAFVGNVDGRVYSFELESGEIAWTHSAGDFVYSGIAAADTRRTKPAVYFGSHDGLFYALDARNGSEVWTESPGGQVSGPATVVGTIAYVSTFAGGSTVGFNVATGRRVFKINEGEYGPVVSDGKRLYVVGDSTITMLEPAKRKAKRKLRKPEGTKGIVGAAPRKVKG